MDAGRRTHTQRSRHAATLSHPRLAHPPPLPRLPRLLRLLRLRPLSHTRGPLARSLACSIYALLASVTPRRPICSSCARSRPFIVPSHLAPARARVGLRGPTSEGGEGLFFALRLLVHMTLLPLPARSVRLCVCASFFPTPSVVVARVPLARAGTTTDDNDDDDHDRNHDDNDGGETGVWTSDTF